MTGSRPPVSIEELRWRRASFLLGRRRAQRSHDKERREIEKEAELADLTVRLATDGEESS